LFHFGIYLGYFLLAVNTIFLLIGFKKNDTPFKAFCIYSVCMFCVQLISWYMASILHRNNIYISHFYFWLQFLTLSIFFYYLIPSTKIKQGIVYSTLAVTLIIAVSYILNPKQFFTFNYVEISTTAFAIIIYALIHLYNMLSEQKKYYNLIIGLIIYLFGSTIIFLAGNLAMSLPKGTMRNIWSLNIYLYVVYQGLILFELYKMQIKKVHYE
jgi:hypothetical protein